MAEKTREATVKALVKELSKTKGGVTVTEEDGMTIVRTRDGDEHRFEADAWKPVEGA